MFIKTLVVRITIRLNKTHDNNNNNNNGKKQTIVLATEKHYHHYCFDDDDCHDHYHHQNHHDRCYQLPTLAAASMSEIARSTITIDVAIPRLKQ